VKIRPLICLLAAALGVTAQAAHAAVTPMSLKDVMALEYATDPQFAPDGKRIVYVRQSADPMTDRFVGAIWSISVDGDDHRPLVQEADGLSSPRFSPDGRRLLYLATAEERTVLRVRWMDTGETLSIEVPEGNPAGPVWSPDGRQIAFAMMVKGPAATLAELPPKPEGAEWAPPVKVVDRMVFRRDGQSFDPSAYRQIFVVPADGGTARQLTSGNYDHGPAGAAPAAAWMPDGKSLIFSANRRADAEREPNDSELYEFDLASGRLTALTDRYGPDAFPVVSPDGGRIAYLGLDDRHQGYMIRRLYVLERESGESRLLSGELDRDVSTPRWDRRGRTLTISYDDQGDTHIARIGLDGRLTDLARGMGGTTLGRPYASGQFDLAPDGRIAYTATTPSRPGEIAVAEGGKTRVLTDLNGDVLGQRSLAEVEEIVVESSHDGQPIQGWIAKPPGFDPSRNYPLVLEIHGGPFANYGVRFAAEVQLYAAAGYVVLYVNPRGSTSYGEAFGNLIHHAYPGHDYDDLMSAVDGVVARGYVDEARLFVTGGSGGGVLTAWIVGKTDRFRAAVVAKPVINWTSFVLTADAANFFYRYWFPGLPWDHPEHYRERSPLYLVGNVTTPTMLLTGESDYRTPISESEQYYQALKLQGVDTLLVRVPEASHGIARRPSQLMAKVANILAWFARYDEPVSDPPASASADGTGSD
jgi:acylaminoacyl-peptidase